jgi:two-component system copper resistance phosphate regulon response regulator CusR
MRVLVVEDEKELREAIARRLRAQGHAVDEAADGSSAEYAMSVYGHALVILDRMLPDGDAVDRLALWRSGGNQVPVLFLTARDRVGDRVRGLAAGADDYLVKPFAMEELLARVAAIARRGSAPRPSRLRVGDLELDSARREVRRAEVLLPLRPKEYALLELLMTRFGRVVSREEIIDCCWDEAHEPSSNVEETLIASLRRKLGEPALIRTVRGAGYILEENDRGG